MMEDLVARAEARSGISRHEMASQMVFVSHETYTPARGGSASAEINALRRVFGAAADQIVIANTKGFTGHAMGAGIEDVVAVKALETGCVPPVANFKEVDPELGPLNLSKGGCYPVEYALRLGAGFGSQISMTLMRWLKTKDAARPSPNALGYAYRIVDPKRLECLALPDGGLSDRGSGSGPSHAAGARSRHRVAAQGGRPGNSDGACARASSTDAKAGRRIAASPTRTPCQGEPAKSSDSSRQFGF